MIVASMGMDASHPHAQRVSMDPQCDPFTSLLPRDMSLTVLWPTFRNLAGNSAPA